MSRHNHNLKQSLYFASFSLVAAALNYFLYPVAARLSSPEFFGSFNTFMSIFIQGSALLLSLNVISLYFLNNHPKDFANKQIVRLQGISSLFITIFLVCSILFAPWFSRLINVTDNVSLILTYISIFLMIPAVIWATYLQVQGQLTHVAIYNALVAGLRLISCSYAIVATHSMSLVIGALILSQIAGLLYLYVVAKEKPPFPSVQQLVATLFDKHHESNSSFIFYIVVTLIVLQGVGILTSYDVVMIRTLFGENAAGHYSAIAVFGKMIYFAASIIIWFIMPKITVAKPTESRRALMELLKFMLAIGSVLMIALIATRSTLLSYIVGNSYYLDPWLLIVICIEQLLASMLMGYAMYLLVLRRGRAILLVSLCILLTAVCMYFYHNTPTTVAVNFLIGISVGTLMYGIINYILPRNRSVAL